MLDQRGLVVVQDQVFQSAVQVVRLGETVAAGRAVDDAVLHLAVHAKERNEKYDYETALSLRSDSGLETKINEAKALYIMCNQENMWR